MHYNYEILIINNFELFIVVYNNNTYKGAYGFIMNP